MEIISYFESDNKTYWLDEIAKCDWRAAAYLHKMLSEGIFFDVLGEGSELFLLADGDKLISFCTYSKRDEIRSDNMSPWIGFVYTFPLYRGNRFIGRLFERIEASAKADNIPAVYLSTDHIGLYERYGFEFLREMESIYGDMSRVYVKHIAPLKKES